MNPFMIYLLGSCITGFLFMVFMYIPSFEKYMNDSIDEAKKEMKNNNEYSLQEITLLENIENKSIINTFNIVAVLFSWIGLLIVVFNILAWIIKLTKNLFK